MSGSAQSCGSRAAAAAGRLVWYWLVLLVLLVLWRLLALPPPLAAPSASTNPIVAENALPGSSEWWHPQSAEEPLLHGFSTSFSVQAGQTVTFKIHAPAWMRSYHVGVYRLGYYGGLGARLLANLSVANAPQPACHFDARSRATHCSNWRHSLAWTVPLDTPSGVMVALPVWHASTDTNASANSNSNSNSSYRYPSTCYGSYIPFVVRQSLSEQGSALLFKTSDLTWAAYNSYGGYNLYRGNGSFDPSSRASAASYDRPWRNRALPPAGQAHNFIFGAEYALLRWLERMGYDVSYASCGDVEQLHRLDLPSLSRQSGQGQGQGEGQGPRHSVLLSVGHDEYWTPGLRRAFEGARDSGVHLAFFSGNEAFWRTLWAEDLRVRDGQAQGQGQSQGQVLAQMQVQEHSQDGQAGSVKRAGAAGGGEEGAGEEAGEGADAALVAYLLDALSQQLVPVPPHRLLICRKETIENTPFTADFTGTFRDPRQGRGPLDAESLLTGQHFMVNAHSWITLRSLTHTGGGGSGYGGSVSGPGAGRYVLELRGRARDRGGGRVAAVEVSLDGGRSWLPAEGTAYWHFSALLPLPHPPLPRSLPLPLHLLPLPLDSAGSTGVGEGVADKGVGAGAPFTAPAALAQGQRQGQGHGQVRGLRDGLLSSGVLVDLQGLATYLHSSSSNSGGGGGGGGGGGSGGGGSGGAGVQLLVLVRAIDDSGWLERTDELRPLCSMHSRAHSQGTEAQGLAGTVGTVGTAGSVVVHTGVGGVRIEGAQYVPPASNALLVRVERRGERGERRKQGKRKQGKQGKQGRQE
ncbi:hypothetical protein B484DRAFT_428352 [Ochromonadaceae sp. CCMP2298]|nr:hypothetical protein B484DRAFT_428352 [Ochromonadaceae sp. CCMP2298]